MKAYERLLKYVVVRTPSDENSETVPSSKCQFDLANILVDELKELGVEAHVDDQCYVYGKIPATPGYENCPRWDSSLTWTRFPISATMTSFR